MCTWSFFWVIFSLFIVLVHEYTTTCLSILLKEILVIVSSWTITNKAAMNLVFLWVHAFILLGINLGVELLVHMLGICFVLVNTSRSISKCDCYSKGHQQCKKVSVIPLVQHFVKISTYSYVPKLFLQLILLQQMYIQVIEMS